MLTRRLIIAAGTGAVLGLFCIAGAWYRSMGSSSNSWRDVMVKRNSQPESPAPGECQPSQAAERVIAAIAS